MDKILVKRCVSNKKAGIKSLHYYDNKIFLEDSFATGTDILFSGEFEDVHNLSNLQNVVEIKKNLECKTHKQGISLIRINQNNHDELLMSNIRVGKQKNLFKDDHNNNFDLQIKANIEDIFKIIGANLSQIVYTLNALFSRDDKNEIAFDFVGTFPAKVNIFEYTISDRQKNVLSYNDFKNLPYKLKEHEINIDYLSKYLSKYYFKNNSEKNTKLNELRQKFSDDQNKLKDDYLINIIASYDIIRIISFIRQIVSHTENEFRVNKDDEILKLAKYVCQKIVNGFIDEFTKNNSKYLQILSNLNIDESKGNFFDYVIFDKAKFLNVSVNKIYKQLITIIDKDKIAEDVQPDKQGEFKQKYKFLLKYLIYLFVKRDEDEYIKYGVLLKSVDDKEQVYIELAQKFNHDMEEKNLYISLKNEIVKVLGKVDVDIQTVKYNKITINNDICNLYYLMSLMLNKKEANQFFSNLIDRFSNILDLIKLGEKCNLKSFAIASEDDLLKRELFLACDIKLNEELKEGYFEKIIDDLNILKSLRLKVKEIKIKAKENKILSYLKVLFDTDIENVEINQQLKNSINNAIIQSRKFQYISKYAYSNIIPQLMSFKNVVLMVLEKMYENNKITMEKYLLTAINKFKHENTLSLTKEDLEMLANELSSLKLGKVINILKNVNYQDNNMYPILDVYLTVSYVLLKNLIKINSSYKIMFDDYFLMQEKKYKQVDEKKYSFNLLNDIVRFLIKNNAIDELKTKKSFVQLMSYYGIDKNNFNKETLKEKLAILRDGKNEWIKKFIIDKNKFNKIMSFYRNYVFHMNWCQKDCFDLKRDNLLSKVKCTSYFALYQFLLRTYLENNRLDFDDVFKVKDNKLYSVKFCIAINLVFAYNVSRFNNNVFEKYSDKRFK